MISALQEWRCPLRPSTVPRSAGARRDFSPGRAGWQAGGV